VRKSYYPLFPCKGKKYRPKKSVVYIYVDSDTNSKFTGGAVYENNSVEYFDNSLEVARYLTFLPDNTWVITYNLSSWSSCFEAFINTFDYIGGIGKDNHILNLEYGNKKITIIDAFQFYVMPFLEAVYKMGGLKFSDLEVGLCSVFVNFLWEKLVAIYKEKFNVYPSKTPGATAIKIFRRFMKSPILASGLQAIRLTTSSIRPPALHWKPGIYEEAYLYDLNAAYPHVMRVLRYPKRLRLFINQPPPSDRWIATLKIDYTCNRDFSPLSIQLKEDNRINPTEAKNVTVTLTYIDLQTLEMCGEVKILSWLEGVYWKNTDEVDLFSEWAEAMEAASLENPQNKIALKIVSRSLHSKFSQSHFFTETEIFKTEPQEIKKLVKTGKVSDIYPLENGEIAIKKITRKRAGFKPFERPDWEALTLAMGRFMMYANIDENTVYSHTDCIISTAPRDDIQIGVKFGEWKNKEVGAAYIAGLGLYAIGESIGTTGLKTSKIKAREAIREAAAGIEHLVTTLNYPGFLSSTERGLTDFTVRFQPYPQARVNGTLAWVTRSPTRIIPIITNHRIISTCKLERSLKINQNFTLEDFKCLHL